MRGLQGLRVSHPTLSSPTFIPALAANTPRARSTHRGWCACSFSRLLPPSTATYLLEKPAMSFEIETMAEQAMAVNLVSAACLTALLYDHATTIDQEVSRMWPTRVTIPKFLFFTNRYPVEAMLLFNCISASRPYQSNDFCVFYLRWLTITTTISTSVVQGILVLRVWALYRRNRWALFVAFFFYLGGTATLVGLVIQDYVGEDVLIEDSLASLPGCYATSVPSMIAGFWIAPLIVETVLFVLVISRAFVWWRDGVAAPRIFTLLARDSTVYFSVVFALLLANFFVFQFGPPFLSSLLVTPSATAGCILGSHMLLNLRAMVAPTAEELKTSRTENTVMLPIPRTQRGTDATRTSVPPRASSTRKSARIVFRDPSDTLEPDVDVHPTRYTRDFDSPVQWEPGVPGGSRPVP